MDEQAAEKLISSLYRDWYSSLLHYLCRLTGGRHDAEDIIQEAFLLLYQECRKGTVIDNAKGWTFRVVRRLVAKRFRVVTLRAEAAAELLADCPAVSAFPETTAMDSESDLHAAFSVLTTRELEVVLLRLDGLKYREIADTLGVTVSSVNTLLARGLPKLQRELFRNPGRRLLRGYLEKPHIKTLQ